MVIVKDKPIDMPRPFCGNAPVITVGPRSDGKPGRYITVQITGPIESLYQFTEFLQVLDMANENDVIDVVLDTPGGCVFTTQVLLEHMNSCKAQVTSVANGLVASAGTFLWFFSKNRKINDWATFMFHCSSHVDYGKTLAIQETANEMAKFNKDTVLQMIAGGILTKEEAGKIFKQKKDLFVPGSILRARVIEAIAATEGIALRAEDVAKTGDYQNPDAGGTDFKKDRPEDPEGQKDPAAHDNIDGKTSDFNPEAIFKAEGLELDPPAGDTGTGTGDGGDNGGDNGQGGDTGTGDDGQGTGTDANGKCGKGKKKGAKADDTGTGTGDDDQGTGDDGQGDGGTGTGDGSTVDTPLPADQTSDDTPMSAYLKW